MNRTILWILLSVSAIFFLYPSVTTLLDVLEVISNAPTLPTTVLETRDRAIMQVLGFISLYVFLGFLLHSYKDQTNQQGRIDNYRNKFFSAGIELDPLYSVLVGGLVTVGAIAIQYFLGLTDSSELISGVAQPIAISIVAGVISGLIAFLMIDKLNENQFLNEVI